VTGRGAPRDEAPGGLEPTGLAGLTVAWSWRVAIAVAGVAAGAGMAVRLGWRPALAAFVLFAVLSVVLMIVDVEQHRLPDVLTLPGLGGGAALFVLDGSLTGSWQAVLHAVVSAAVVFALLFALAMLSPSGMGFGDVKLGALIALFSGWIGYAAAAMAIAAGFVVGAWPVMATR